MILKKTIRHIVPNKIRFFLWSITPKIKIYLVYKIIQQKPIEKLTAINDKFLIRPINNYKEEIIKNAYTSRHFDYYEKKVLPRLKDPRWVGFVVENKDLNEIAYISWVVKSNVEFIDDLSIKMNPNQFFLRDAFCLPEYRLQGLNTRMDEERINYCICNGANEILFQIGRKTHPHQNLLRRYEAFEKDYYLSEEGIRLVLLKKNYMLLIPKFNIHRDLFSFLKNPFKK